MSDEIQKTFNILSVEDNASDRHLIARLFRPCTVNHRLFFARDGEEACDFLFRRGQFSEAPTPDLVLLDLNMPKKDGREVLQEIKSTPGLKNIPVVILTTSSTDTDVMRAYAGSANSYFQKPRDLEKFQTIIQLIAQYWLNSAVLPPPLTPAHAPVTA
jgi:two-component system, chemotaxis family, response regulator Rcp1